MSKNLTKAELIGLVAKDAELTKTKTEKAINAAMLHIKETLSNGRNVTLIGFGTFTTAKRAARTGRNPQTGKKMNIPAKVVPKFRPGKDLAEAVGDKKKGKKKKK
jgi:DNA-binding protein HU-beta